MNYAKIINCPLRNILKLEKNQINWEYYGFKVQDLMRLSYQSAYNGDFYQILPISDLTKFNETLSEIEAVIDSDLYPNDSIEIITEIEAAGIKQTIETSKVEEVN